MKTIFTKLPEHRAQTEIKYSAYASVIFGIVGLFIFYGIGIIGTAIGIRGILLTRNEGNKNNKSLVLYRNISILGVVIGAVSWIYYLSR